jgi:hypothetical protein
MLERICYRKTMAILCLAIGRTGNQLVGWRDEQKKNVFALKIQKQNRMLSCERMFLT